METYFYMDHASEACVAALPNLVPIHKSMQNHVIYEEKETHLKCCFGKKLFTCWRMFLSRF